jgi:hypothetical protein
MQYAAHLPALPSRRSVAAPVVALVLGAAAAVGGYALIDNQDVVPATADKVVFVDTPGPGEGVRGIDDTAKAAAIGSAPTKVAPYLTHGSAPASDDAERANRADPHWPAAGLH